MRTIVYVDGFNLYYRALQNSRHKWLNLHALCEAVLPAHCNIITINYYTARVSGRRNPESPRDQNIYLNALKTLPNLKIHFGNFQVSNKWMFMVQPIEFRPACIAPQPPPEFVKVVKTEEKGSDVNLGVHLVRDAYSGAFERAAVITNDTDLTEPLRIVVEDAGLAVTLMTPVAKPAESLRSLASDIRHISSYLGVSQFSETVQTADGKSIQKPADW